MEWITKQSIGVAIIAAAFAVQEASGQTRSSLIAHGVGSTNAQRVGQAPIPTGVFVAPTAGVNEDLRRAGAYGVEYASSESAPAMAEQVTPFSLEEEKNRAEALMEGSQTGRRRRPTVRPIDAPMTLGMLKEKPATRNMPQTVRAPISPQYLRYAPNALGAGMASPTSSAAQPTQPLNWDGSTKRGNEFGRVQPPTLPELQPVPATNPAELVNMVDEDFAAPEFATVSEFPQIATQPELLPESTDELLAPETSAAIQEPVALEESIVYDIPSVPESTEPAETVLHDESENFAQSVLQELRGGESLTDEPTVEEPLPVDPAFVAPDFAREEPMTTIDAPATDVPDFANLDELDVEATTEIPMIPTSPEPDEALVDVDAFAVEPVDNAALPTTEDVEAPIAEMELNAPQPSTEAPSPVIKSQETPAVGVQELIGEESVAEISVVGAEPAVKSQEVAPANRPINPSYHTVAPVIADPRYPRHTPALPRQFGVPEFQSVGRQGRVYSAAPYPFDPSYNGYYYGGKNYPLSFDATMSTPGLIFGAEWLYWTTDSDKSYALVSDGKGALDGRDLQVESGGLRGRVGFRTLTGWDLIGSYTFFKEDDFGEFRAAMLKSGEKLTNNRVGKEIDLDSIASDLSTELQVVDLEIGRSFKSGALDVRLFGGVRWSSLTETVCDSYGYNVASGASLDAFGGEIAVLDAAFADVDDSDSDSALFNALVDDRSNAVAAVEYSDIATTSRLNAYGVRLGLETRLELGGGFGVYGKGAAALAAGRVKSTLYDEDWKVQEAFKKTYLTPSVDASLGLSWKYNALEARAGYEFNGWYNSGYAAGEGTDFLAHGVVAGLGYNY